MAVSMAACVKLPFCSVAGKIPAFLEPPFWLIVAAKTAAICEF